MQAPGGDAMNPRLSIDRARTLHSMPALLLAMVSFASAPRLAIAGRVITVTDQTQDAIQRALYELGGPGTVVVPPGSYAIEGTLQIPNDEVTLLGPGPDPTLFSRSTEATNTSMIRVRGFQRVRISGIQFEGPSSPDSTGTEVGILLENAASFRIDHCSFSHLGFAGVRTNGSSSGVVDHCGFREMYRPRVGTDGYGVAVFGNDVLEGLPFGTDQATFIEDSTFVQCRHAVASNRGARYVFRFNNVAQNDIAHAVDAHGTESGSRVGTEWVDVHDNTIAQPLFQRYAVRIRGGAGVIWNNHFFDYGQGIELTQDTLEPTGPVYIWGNEIDPASSPMVRARGGSVYYPDMPKGYTPYPYPHPLALGDGL